MAKPVNELIDYKYSGLDRRKQKVSGEISSRNMELAKAQLRKQGLQVERIAKKPKPLYEFKPKIKAMDIAIFSRQMATMMKSGVPLVQSFEIVAESADNATMRDLVLGLKKEVESGSTFSSSLQKYPQYFDDLFCSLVSSGEQSGALETMLDRVATYKEKSELMKMKIKKAMKYPIAVVVVAVIVTIILLVKVVPVFADLFSSFGADLPSFTQLVVGWSEWMQAKWWLLLIIIGLTIAGFSEAKKRSKGFRDFLDRAALKAPIVGNIVYNSIIARYSRTLATTFAAGVPLIDALESTAGATNNVVYNDAVMRIREDVSSGQQLQFAMRSTKLFPSMAVQMVGIGEESGNVDDMLDKVATYYENEVDNAVDGLTSLMEPLIMAVLGVLVGGLVIAMYLPIFQLGSVV